MDIVSTEDGETKEEGILVILVGAPGSGKSTFCEDVMRISTRPWLRVCQDTIGNGKAGTKVQCLTCAASALKDGKSVFIDRCNLDREQRADFLKLGGSRHEMHAVVLDLPAKLCISRSVKRTGHEGNLQGGKAAAVVNRMLQKKELPKLSEGFSRITLCQSETDVQAAVNTYGALGAVDSLPSGCFGQKTPAAKVQVGIMKFLKKVDAPNGASNISQGSAGNHLLNGNNIASDRPENGSNSLSKVGMEVSDDKEMDMDYVDRMVSFDEVHTLAFPSISTADFQFNLEKASDIIVEQVEVFLKNNGNVRLYLVDLSHKSKILSLVSTKASQKNIDSSKFCTFVGDITRLYSQGNLRCNVIANAANWRLLSGGGGVNAAIYSAAGQALDTATKELAGSLMPGKALVVPLPSTSPLFSREGITHVIHVLGPNMNPNRANCLHDDYNKGCKVLRAAYSSLFEGFASIIRTQEMLNKESVDGVGLETKDHLEPSSSNQFPVADRKGKRDGIYESEGNKKSKGSEIKTELSGSKLDISKDQNNEKCGKSTSKRWGSWAQALYNITMHPEKHKSVVLETSDDTLVLSDQYPKAQNHLLVLARVAGLDQLADVRTEHLPLLETMHNVGLKWAEKLSTENKSLIFRLGYHSVPSMRQLHLHVISQDFNSKHLKNKKHWQSFNSPFFRDSVDVIEEVRKYGKATLNDEERYLSMELRCHRCRSAHPNIPRLKSHISSCNSPFPSALLQNGRLVLPPSNVDT